MGHEKVLEFLKEFQIQFERTRLFCQRVKELQLFEPMQANVTTAQGEKFALGGFLGVSREKLRQLSGEQLQKLAKTDELELLYLHLTSLRNFTEFKDRLAAAQPGDAESKSP